MDLFLYVLVPIALVALGVGARVLQARLAGPAARRFCARLALAAFGSTIIIWSVYLLSGLLSVLVIVVGTSWFTRRVFIGPIPMVRAIRPGGLEPFPAMRPFRSLRTIIPFRSRAQG